MYQYRYVTFALFWEGTLPINVSGTGEAKGTNVTMKVYFIDLVVKRKNV
jgi:hypothetical protein